eukprot:1315332-Rhodomonas_salina.1
MSYADSPGAPSSETGPRDRLSPSPSAPGRTRGGAVAPNVRRTWRRARLCTSPTCLPALASMLWPAHTHRVQAPARLLGVGQIELKHVSVCQYQLICSKCARQLSSYAHSTQYHPTHAPALLLSGNTLNTWKLTKLSPSYISDVLPGCPVAPIFPATARNCAWSTFDDRVSASQSAIASID